MSLAIYSFPGDSQHAKLSEVGGKALSLLKGSDAGLPVPPGFVLPVGFFEQWLADLKQSPNWKNFLSAQSPDDLKKACDALKNDVQKLDLSQTQSQALSEALKKFPEHALFAVRSSSPEEDLEGSSFAGGYETVLGVTRETMQASIKKAFASCLDIRVVVYKREHGFGIDDPKIALAVQEQIASGISGVGFSLNPITNNYDEAIFNANWGLGESVVAGLVSPDEFCVDKTSAKITNRILGSKELSIWLNESGGTSEKSNYKCDQWTLSDDQIVMLTELIKKVEGLYEKPIDIEWAFCEGKLYLLQARPITTFIPLPSNMVTRRGEKKRVYLDITISVQGVYAPLSTMGTSIFGLVLSRFSKTMFSKDITTDLETTLPIATAGRLYLNLSNLLVLTGTKQLSEFWTNMDPLAAQTIATINEREYEGNPQIKHLPLHALWKLPEIVGHLVEAELMPEHARRHVEQEIQHFVRIANELNNRQMPLSDFTLELFDNLVNRVVRNCLPIVIASRIALREMKHMTEALDPESSKRLEMALPHNVTTEMGLALATVARLLPESLDADQLQKGIADKTLPPAFLEAWQNFLEIYGHRGPVEIDIASPRYRDNPRLLMDLMLSMRGSDGEDPLQKFERNQLLRHQAYEKLCEQIHEKGWLATKRFQWLYKVVEPLAGYRETPKFYLIFAIDLLRKKVMQQAKALVDAKRLESIAQVFDLTLEQLERGIDDVSIDLIQQARTNRAVTDKLKHLQLPTIIDSRGLILRPPTPPATEGVAVGTPISSGSVRGPVKVLHSPDEKPFEKGEILVARATDPGWTPLFVNAAGVILEIGGVLQHGALVAREYGLPCVGGVANATNLWTDGTMVEVDGSAGTIKTL